ncbi:MAG: quinolinate synthase NadA [Candidatus Aenigmarchaeota archaeon]|nr:quinolinate synthase NadA [Candidatus Aenigmarchaeota archaeon]
MEKELVNKILELKKKKKAVILAHNYQRPEIYEVADFIGDSLELSMKAKETKAKIIVFCGVDFMAEAAKILNPKKKVLLPDPEAKCPMAAMVNIERLRDLKKKHPGARVVCYINTTAETKAESDIVCTSMNAANIVDSLEGEVIFIPDQHLGRWVEEKTGKKLILWPGFCIVHDSVLLEEVEDLKKKHPGAEVISHPESPIDILRISDCVCGTGGMIKYASSSKKKEFIIVTEEGMCNRLRREIPGKKFYPAAGMCQNMKRITLEKVYESLKDEKYEVKIPKEIEGRAREALGKMLEFR